MRVVYDVTSLCPGFTRAEGRSEPFAPGPTEDEHAHMRTVFARLLMRLHIDVIPKDWLPTWKP
jgi:hypothetical protein